MFKDHNAAQAAINAYNSKKEVNGKVLFVSKHISKAENSAGSSTVTPINQVMQEQFKSNICVRYIPKWVTDKEFEDKMSTVGTIRSFKLKNHEITVAGVTEVAYKIGYVFYEDVKQAQKCIQTFDQSNTFGYGCKPLRVDFWQSQNNLKSENDEKNINQVKKIIHFIQ
jgi:ABC-type phosphate transport system substrate-binding protein